CLVNFNDQGVQLGAGVVARRQDSRPLLSRRHANGDRSELLSSQFRLRRSGNPRIKNDAGEYMRPVVDVPIDWPEYVSVVVDPISSCGDEGQWRRARVQIGTVLRDQYQRLVEYVVFNLVDDPRGTVIRILLCHRRSFLSAERNSSVVQVPEQALQRPHFPMLSDLSQPPDA